MHVPPPKPTRKPEITIALINIVFLLLVFFLIAGTITSNENQDVEPALSLLSDSSQPPDGAVFLDQGGSYRFGGETFDAAGVVAAVNAAGPAEAGRPTMLVPDRRLKAQQLIKALDELNALGLTHLTIVTVRGTGKE